MPQSHQKDFSTRMSLHCILFILFFFFTFHAYQVIEILKLEATQKKSMLKNVGLVYLYDIVSCILLLKDLLDYFTTCSNCGSAIHAPEFYISESSDQIESL